MASMRKEVNRRAKWSITNVPNNLGINGGICRGRTGPKGITRNGRKQPAAAGPAGRPSSSTSLGQPRVPPHRWGRKKSKNAVSLHTPRIDD